MEAFSNLETRNLLRNVIENELKLSLNDFEKWLRTPPKLSTLRLPQTSVGNQEEEKKLLGKVEAKIFEQYERKGKLQKLPKTFAENRIPGVIFVESVGSSLESEKPERRSKIIVIDTKCAAAVLRGADIFVPGIVGCPSNLETGDEVTVIADLQNKTLKGSRTENVNFEGDNGQRFLILGNGISKVAREQIFAGSNPESRSGIGIEMTDCIFDCPALNSIAETLGLFPQNLPSILASAILNPTEGSTVLDMCAAPGGKTTHLASLVGPLGKVFAFDKSTQKIDQINSLARRLNVDGVVDARVKDSRKLLQEESGDANSFPPESFNFIMLDAPCSALGQRPQLANSITPSELRSFPKLQKQLFATAFELLAVGGSLVYSTCTFMPDENEGLVRWALDKFPGRLELLPISMDFLNLDSGGGSTILTSDEAEKCLRFCQVKDFKQSSGFGDTIGFFIAKFKKLK